jgi:hypothetical protein
MQTMQLPLLSTEAPATCCCTHRDGDARCGCPVCTHHREAESGKPFLKTCGAASAPVAMAATDMGVPAAVIGTVQRTPRVCIGPPLDIPAPDPTPDVPTPPPLALA